MSENKDNNSEFSIGIFPREEIRKNLLENPKKVSTEEKIIYVLDTLGGVVEEGKIPPALSIDVGKLIINSPFVEFRLIDTDLNDSGASEADMHLIKSIISQTEHTKEFAEKFSDSYPVLELGEMQNICADIDRLIINGTRPGNFPTTTSPGELITQITEDSLRDAVGKAILTQGKNVNRILFHKYKLAVINSYYAMKFIQRMGGDYAVGTDIDVFEKLSPEREGEIEDGVKSCVEMNLRDSRERNTAKMSLSDNSEVIGVVKSYIWGKPSQELDKHKVSPLTGREIPSLPEEWQPDFPQKVEEYTAFFELEIEEYVKRKQKNT